MTIHDMQAPPPHLDFSRRKGFLPRQYHPIRALTINFVLPPDPTAMNRPTTTSARWIINIRAPQQLHRAMLLSPIVQSPSFRGRNPRGGDHIGQQQAGSHLLGQHTRIQLKARNLEEDSRFLPTRRKLGAGEVDETEAYLGCGSPAGKRTTEETLRVRRAPAEVSGGKPRRRR